MKRFGLLSLLLLLHCVGDAPHDNPLDGDGGLTIQGTIQTYYAPHLPLAMVPVYLKKQKLLTFTDASGQFSFTHLAADSYLVIAGGSAFSQDSLQVDLKKNVRLQFRLDRLPQFEEITVSTHHQAHWFPVEDSYYLQIAVRLNDPDGIGDLDRVFFEIPEYTISDTLLPGQNPGEFYYARNVNDLPVRHLEELIGRAFLVKATDDAGFTATAQPVFITRVIEQTTQLLAPVGLQTITGDTIHFQWQAVYLNFPFHYKLEIFQVNNGVPTTVKIVDSLPPDLPNLNYVHQPPSGEYLWRVYIIDEFGNSSRSKEGAFQIP